MIQLFDRAGQQIEVERTSFIAFCDEGEVSGQWELNNSQSVKSFMQMTISCIVINQLHEID